MFQKNSGLRRIFVPVDVGLRSGHLWVRLSGLLRRQKLGQLFTLRLETGSKLANRIIGYTGAKLDGLPNGRLSKSSPVAVVRNNADTLTMMLSIVNGADLQKGSGSG